MSDPIFTKDSAGSRSIQEVLTSPNGHNGAIRGQIESVAEKKTKDGKPYYDLAVADGTGRIALKVWDNHPAFWFCKGVEAGDFISLLGTFVKGKYGLESADWRGCELLEDEVEELLNGTQERREFLEDRWVRIQRLAVSIEEPTLLKLTTHLLKEYEEPYRRAAAARGNHHARRGGLVEHVSLMLEAGDALCRVYPEVNRSLVLAGIIFHDAGKMWENQYEPDGFAMPVTARAELYGHIPMGLMLLQKLARGLELAPEVQPWVDMLAHIILSHHGTLEWGSPVEPKMPEAMLVHYVDNLDAKLEMARAMFASAPEIAPGVFEKVYPMRVNLVKTLPEA